MDEVIQGQPVLDLGMVQKLARLYSHDSRWLRFGLTTVEQDVLELATEGYDDAEIAANLRVAASEIQDALEGIYEKFELAPHVGQGEQEDQTRRRVQAIQVFVNHIVVAIGELENNAW